MSSTTDGGLAEEAAPARDSSLDCSSSLASSERKRKRPVAGTLSTKPEHDEWNAETFSERRAARNVRSPSSVSSACDISSSSSRSPEPKPESPELVRVVLAPDVDLSAAAVLAAETLPEESSESCDFDLREKGVVEEGVFCLLLDVGAA